MAPRMGVCSKIYNNEEYLFPWSTEPCQTALPFVCQMDACHEGIAFISWIFDYFFYDVFVRILGEFKCRDGRCIQGSFVGDEENDCGDYSDEWDTCKQCFLILIFLHTILLKFWEIYILLNCQCVTCKYTRHCVWQRMSMTLVVVLLRNVLPKRCLVILCKWPILSSTMNPLVSVTFPQTVRGGKNLSVVFTILLSLEW